MHKSQKIANEMELLWNIYRGAVTEEQKQLTKKDQDAEAKMLALQDQLKQTHDELAAATKQLESLKGCLIIPCEPYCGLKFGPGYMTLAKFVTVVHHSKHGVNPPRSKKDKQALFEIYAKELDALHPGVTKCDEKNIYGIHD